MSGALSTTLERLARDESGAALVELAIVVPPLSVKMLGIVDFSLLTISNMMLDAAARNGADYAATNGFDSTSIASAITSSATRSGYMSSISASPAPTQWYGCANSNTGVTVANSASSTCTGGQLAGTYVTANAQATYTFIVRWPTLPATMTLSSSKTVRID